MKVEELKIITRAGIFELTTGMRVTTSQIDTFEQVEKYINKKGGEDYLKKCVEISKRYLSKDIDFPLNKVEDFCE